MAEKLNIHVPAVPVAQPRPRAVITGEKSARVHEVTHIKQVDGTRKIHPIAAFKASVMLAAQQVHSGPPFARPVHISIDFVMPRPKNKFWKTKPMPRERHVVKPDIDNLIKSVLDAMNHILWFDDSQVSSVYAGKWIAAGDESPHVQIAIELMDSETAT